MSGTAAVHRLTTLAVCLGGFCAIAAARAEPLTQTAGVLPFGPEVTRLGAADAADLVSFQVALKLRNTADLDARVARGERLGATELAARHLPLPGAYRAVRAWLVAQGLTVDRDTDDRLMIAVHGSAAQVGRALGIGFARVGVEAHSFVATEQAPALPASIAADIESINGLQPYGHMDRLGVAGPNAGASSARSGASPAVTYSGYYYPAGILRAYKAAPYLTQNGQGTRTAILIDTLPHTTDLTKFWKLVGSSQTLANVELVNVPGGSLPAPSGEESLDTEWASGIGYGSKVRVYAAGSLYFTALDVALHAIMSDLGKGLAINQLSISLGSCETHIASGQISTDNSLLESIAAQGVSIFASTGDSGSAGCGSGGNVADFYATSPYVTAVGGTHLIITAKSNTAPKVTIKSETAWSGGGGGVSGVFAQPSYQSGLSYAGRAIPDVAAVADPNTGVDIVLDGQTSEIGGTSASAPIWAGLMALVNQARFAAGLPELGPLNPRIYPLLGTANFRDITQGSNGGYRAGVGYDLTSGLGSPVMNQLLPTLAAQP